MGVTDCPHDIIHGVRIDTPDGQRASAWVCVDCAQSFTPRDSRNRALADFVAAFDACFAVWSSDTMNDEFRAMLAARAALDATEDS